MSDVNPISIRLTTEEQDKLKEIGGKSVAAGVRELLRLYELNKLQAPQESELEMLEKEIQALKSSPFGFDKKEIQILEKELHKAKESYKQKKIESMKDRFLKLVNSAG